MIRRAVLGGGNARLLGATMVGRFRGGIDNGAAALGAGKSFDPEGADANWRRVTVTVHTRQPGPVPVLTAQDVKVYENNRSLPVKSWIAAKAQTAPLDLTIVLDDSIRSTVSLQFGDLAAFLPPVCPLARACGSLMPSTAETESLRISPPKISFGRTGAAYSSG